MKYCRFISAEGPRYGIIETIAGTDQITQIAPGNEVPDFPSAKKIAPIPLASARLLAPVQPAKIVCVGRNYRDHVKELGNDEPPEPVIFLKPQTSLIGPGDKIVRPQRLSNRVDYEAELTIVMGKRCRNLGEKEDVRPYILGYTCANDVTTRDLQRKDGQWTRAKSFDTFCPVGPIVTDEIDPWAGVRVESYVNGAVKQSESTTAFIFPVDVIVRFCAAVMTLLPGDLILTGTPAGIGSIVAGDEVAITIQGIGTLKNPVVDGD
jgi:2-keto-4-pentenoate hydratase/2-oxohepta-3-ene-1,7-dioic acid hydratase in catechol pathway